MPEPDAMAEAFSDAYTEDAPVESTEDTGADFDTFADIALDPEATPEERRGALKEAILACLAEQEDGEYA